jgi:hypothetical protein
LSVARAGSKREKLSGTKKATEEIAGYFEGFRPRMEFTAFKKSSGVSE